MFWIVLEGMMIVALLWWNLVLRNELRISWKCERNWAAIAMRYVRRDIGNPSQEEITNRLLELRGKVGLVPAVAVADADGERDEARREGWAEGYQQPKGADQ